MNWVKNQLPLNRLALKNAATNQIPVSPTIRLFSPITLSNPASIILSVYYVTAADARTFSAPQTGSKPRSSSDSFEQLKSRYGLKAAGQKPANENDLNEIRKKLEFVQKNLVGIKSPSEVDKLGKTIESLRSVIRNDPSSVYKEAIEGAEERWIGYQGLMKRSYEELKPMANVLDSLMNTQKQVEVRLAATADLRPRIFQAQRKLELTQRAVTELTAVFRAQEDAFAGKTLTAPHPSYRIELDGVAFSYNSSVERHRSPKTGKMDSVMVLRGLVVKDDRNGIVVGVTSTNLGTVLAIAQRDLQFFQSGVFSKTVNNLQTRLTRSKLLTTNLTHLVQEKLDIMVVNTGNDAKNKDEVDRLRAVVENASSHIFRELGTIENELKKIEAEFPLAKNRAPVRN